MIARTKRKPRINRRTITVRLPAELHQVLAENVRTWNRSMNQWCIDAIRETIERESVVMSR